MDFLRRFMAGRYGSDQLNNAFLLLACVLMVIEWGLGWRWMSVFILALLLLCYFRMFSRNISGRNEENQKYLSWTAGIRRSFTQTKNRIVQSKDYHIYKCPACGQKIRIPRGKGKICITCPKCRHEFEKRS